MRVVNTNSAGMGASNGDSETTALDAALIESAKGDEEAQAFYDTFFSARLYVPTAENTADAGNGPGTEEDSVSLLVADIDGQGVVPVFDSSARLNVWAEREMPFTVLAGHALIEHLDPALQIALNVGSDGFKLFVAEELGWLREQLASSVHALDGDENDTLTTITLAPPPPQLQTALNPALARNSNIAAAFLVAAENPTTDVARWLLILDVGDAGEAVFAEIARDIGVAAQGALGAGEIMDVIAFNPIEGPGLELLRLGAEPFYTK